MTDKNHPLVSRRRFVAGSAAALAGSLTAPAWSKLRAAVLADEPAPRQATGVKVGEVTDHSAIVWTRLTTEPTRNRTGLAFEGEIGRQQPRTSPDDVSVLEGACPGQAGRIRVRYGLSDDLRDAATTEWADVSAETDFAHQFRLMHLTPGRKYYYAVETTSSDGTSEHGALRGRFETAPTSDSPTRTTFCVTTCQKYHNRDHEDGHNIYSSMLSLEPQFVVFTGDNVYYDSEEPRAVRPDLARYHWHRMHSLPRQVELMRHVAGYWEKDDHDTIDNDSWPGQQLGQLTFDEGVKIFRQIVPFGERAFRTVRWGRDLQIWLTEGRDFRSPNTMTDGPEKTIWGREQKAWLEQTLVESDATWKLLISPTPIVGPDRGKKHDNHSNEDFNREGDEIRRWFQSHVPDNFFVVCGDRHWQYHSVHPETGLIEFACGPACDKHAGGSPGYDENYHRFHRVKGGFLSVSVIDNDGQSTLTFQHRDVLGNKVHAFSRTAQRA